MVCTVKAAAVMFVALISVSLAGCDQANKKPSDAKGWRAEIKQVRMGVPAGEERIPSFSGPGSAMKPIWDR